MAMILGIYNKLISSVSQLRKHFKKNIIFLIIFCGGGLIGVGLFAKPMAMLIEAFPNLTLYFFIGAVIGGVPLIIKESKVKSFKLIELIYIVVGILLVFGIGSMTKVSVDIGSNIDLGMFIYLLVAGIIAAIALVLPGISVSYLLLVMGLYDPIMKAISDMNISFLLPLAVGLIIGILLTTKSLEYIMNKFPKVTYMIILGFVLGSLVELFPGLPQGIEWIGCMITLSLGLGSILYLSKFKAE